MEEQASLSKMMQKPQWHKSSEKNFTSSFFSRALKKDRNLFYVGRLTTTPTRAGDELIFLSQP